MKTYSIWDSIKVFYYVVKFFGYVSFSIDGKIENGKIRSTVRDAAIVTFRLLVLAFIIYLNFKDDIVLIKTKSLIIDLANRLATMFLITNVLFSAMTKIWKRKKIWSIYKHLHDFDGQVMAITCSWVYVFSELFFTLQMKALSMEINHKHVFFGFCFLVPFLVVGMVVLSMLTDYAITGTFMSESSFYFMSTFMSYNGSMTMSIFLVNFNLYCFYLRFDLINTCIKEYFATQEDDLKQVQANKPANLSKIVMKLADLHDSLVEGSIKLNNCFSIEMMNVMAGLFLINITSTFAIYRVFVQDDFDNYSRALVQYAWSVYFAFYGVAFLSLSSLMTRTGKYTAVLIHKAINFIEDDEDPIIDYVS